MNVALPLIRSQDESTYNRAVWIVELIGAAVIDDVPAIIAAECERYVTYKGIKGYGVPAIHQAAKSENEIIRERANLALSRLEKQTAPIEQKSQ